MKDIIVTNTIVTNQISVGFNLSDGKMPFPPVAIDITGDVDLNALINELIKLIEMKRKLSVEFSDSSNLGETNPKIKLIKETLIDIYNKFNDRIEDTQIEQ